MKIYIAKHYWKNGENSTWECHPRIQKSVFEYLKKNYQKFSYEKPNFIKVDKVFIYLCYEESIDFRERKNTHITFFISKKQTNKSLCHMSYENLELNIINKYKIIVPIVLIFIFAFGYIFYLFLENIPQKINKNKLDNNSSIISIQNYKDLNQRYQNTKKQIDNQNLKINYDKSQIEKLKNIYNNYQKALTHGVYCNLIIFENNKQIKYQKLLLNNKEKTPLRENKYAVLLILEETNIVKKLFNKQKFITGNFNITKTDIIKLYNGESLQKELANYTIKLTIFKGKTNAAIQP